MNELESKQQLVEEQLAKMQKEKLPDPVRDESTIKFPVKGVEQSIFRRDFKIQGAVGDPGQKDKLGYQALISQIELGLAKGYADKEVVSAVVRGVQPGLQLRSYLENMTDLTLPRLCKILRFHFHEKNATELYQLLTNIAQQPNEDPQSFLMRVLTIRQKVISASKESDSGVTYDASTVQGLFLHVLETGLADETICAKIRPLTQNPKVADEDLIGAMSLAISPKAERSSKFSLTSKGKSAKVLTVEGSVEANTKKESQKDSQVQGVLKAVQAELATMKSEVKSLFEEASNQKADTMVPSPVGNGVRTGARPPGCQECRRKKEGDQCLHCYLCGGLNHIARYCQTRFRSYPGNAARLPPVGQGVALPEKEKSHQCSGCLKLDCRTQLLQCSACQCVQYCSLGCEKAHWPKHKVLCKAIKEFSERESLKEKGLGDAQDRGVYASHIPPRQQESIVKLVGKKCVVDCFLDDKPTEVL